MIRKITLERFNYYSRTTIGELFLDDDKAFCYTLEDTLRPYGIKVYGETGIPATKGRPYRIGIRHSSKFKRNVLIAYTEDDKVTLANAGISFEYIYLHGGNTHLDTDGCVIVAFNRKSDTSIYGSAENEVFEIVEGWIESGDEVYLEVINKI